MLKRSRDLDHARFQSKITDWDADLSCLETIAKQILRNWEEEMIEDHFSTEHGRANHNHPLSFRVS